MGNNYESDTAFIDVVDRNKAIRKKVDEISAQVISDFDARSARIAATDRVVKKEDARKKEMGRTQRIRAMAGAAAIIAMFAGGITTAIVYGDEISSALEERQQYDDAIRILNNNYMRIFEARSLGWAGMLGTNSIQQYRDLNITTIEEVYFLKYESNFTNYGNFDQEFEKIIRAVSYYNAEGRICHYTSFDEFLKDKGFSSEKEFKEAARARIIELYKANKIKELLPEGMGTANMPLNTGKRGK